MKLVRNYQNILVGYEITKASGYETTNKRKYKRERVRNKCNSITSRDTIKQLPERVQ